MRRTPDGSIVGGRRRPAPTWQRQVACATAGGALAITFTAATCWSWNRQDTHRLQARQAEMLLASGAETDLRAALAVFAREATENVERIVELSRRPGPIGEAASKILDRLAAEATNR
jgi:hypothetical protein